MALTHHGDIELMQGDLWNIPFQLLDLNGAPLDLTGAEFGWYLIGPNGETMTVAEGGVMVTPDADLTRGTGTITLNQSITESLPCGRYLDALRVFYTGLPSIVWIGQILVAADPANPNNLD